MTVVWSIYDHTGAAYNLKGKEVRLYYTCERGRFEVDFEIQGTNEVVWSFLGREQKVIGDYTLSLEIIESAGKRRIFKDYCNAFTLVGKSCEETALGNPNISEDGNIVLSSKLDVYKIQPIIPTVGSNSNWFVDGTDTGKPSTGKSAYEYAKEKGYEGTESEYAESLKLAPENSEKLAELSAKTSNIFWSEVISGYYDVNGAVTSSSASVRDDIYHYCGNGIALECVDRPQGCRITFVFYDKNKSVIKVYTWEEYDTMSIPSNAAYFRVAYNIADGYNPSNFKAFPIKVRSDFYAIDCELEQGTISYDNGIAINNTRRLRTGYLPIRKMVAGIRIPSNYQININLYDANKNILVGGTQGNFIDADTNISSMGLDNACYARIVFKRKDDAELDPVHFGETIYVYIDEKEKDINISSFGLAPMSMRIREGIVYEINGLLTSLSNGGLDEVYYSVCPNQNIGIINNDEYGIRILFYNADKLLINYLDELRTGNPLKKFLVPNDARYFRICYHKEGLTSDTFRPVAFYVLSQGESLVDYVRKEELAPYAKKEDIDNQLSFYQKKSEDVLNIADGAVTLPTLSQSVKDFIEASGGGTITNLADDEDITSVNGLLKFKDREVVRFRKKASYQENLAELERCKDYGLPIQISNVIDFGGADIEIGGHTLIFIGNGQFNNCNINAMNGLNIIADRTLIFGEGVNLWKWDINGITQRNGNAVDKVYPIGEAYDVYDYRSKNLFASNDAINPFFCELVDKISQFKSLTQISGKWCYSEDGINAVLNFEVEDGKIKIPIRTDYLFIDNSGNVLESTYDVANKSANYVYAAPTDVKVSRRYIFKRNVTVKMTSDIYPEWFTDLQSVMLVGGSISLANNAEYLCDGNIRMYGNTEIQGKGSVIKLKPNSQSYCLVEIESRYRQSNIRLFNLTLDGNKNNQTSVQDGIHAKLLNGQYPFTSYSIDDTYWYNLVVQNFSGSGILVGCPGTSHIYSSKLQFNKRDGITWAFEHFTLTNVTCWHNDRHGAYAGGNHWRIIGGAYAHNGAGDNIHCDGAFESQIIGCSCIDSGRFVEQAGGGYIASKDNVYGYIYLGESQGTHALIGGNGISFKNRAYSITMMAVRVNNQNANGVCIDDGCYKITISNCQFNDNNMTKGTFKDVKSSIPTLFIDNTFHEGEYEVTNQTLFAPEYFGTSQIKADWNNICGFLDYKRGVYYVCDYYAADNRPSDAGTYLNGTIQVMDGLSSTAGRTYIRLNDEYGNEYYRYCVIDYATGVYSNDTGWKKK